MGASFEYSKRIAKTGTKLLIALLVIDTTWTLIHYILFNTAFIDETSQNAAILLESIITNLLFTSFITVLAVGMMMFGIYYARYSKIGYISAIFLFAFIGIKVAFIFFRFTQFLGDFNQDYMHTTFHIFELSTSFLLMIAFILYDIFNRQLKNKHNFGYGGSPFVYLFVGFGIVYPISNILSLFHVDWASNNIVFSILRTFAYVATILEIILYFDFLRRFDRFPKLENIKKEEKVEENIQETTS